jgi:hypothetical protein
MASDSAFCGWGMPLFRIQAGYRVVYNTYGRYLGRLAIADHLGLWFN